MGSGRGERGGRGEVGEEGKGGKRGWGFAVKGSVIGTTDGQKNLTPRG